MDHDVWQSPFSWRYGSAEMRALWSETARRRLWRRIWVALAETQADAGLVTAAQVADVRAHQDDVDLPAALAREARLHHDMMAELETFAAQCPVGGGILHLGATSMDVQDNADALRLREALALVLGRLQRVLTGFARKINELADVPTLGFTHLQAAEPTTMGYRLAQYGQDLAADWVALQALAPGLLGKGFKGAVGTAASYAQLLEGTGWSIARFEAGVMARLGLPAAPVATQTAPRKQEYTLLAALAGLGQSVYRFAADLRLLQAPGLAEWAEPFGTHQVGSSAMPFKRNPIIAENVDSLARGLAALPRVAWDNAALSHLERTLDDSANRRSLLPEAFLAADELLVRTARLIEGLRVDPRAARATLDRFGVFAATERLMMALARRGGDRQALHATIREHALAAWSQLAAGGENPLAGALAADPRLLALASADEIRGWLRHDDYVGDAPARARALADHLQTLAQEIPDAG
ncbi:MAG: adenylosuccinate lyase [Myxococcales bacterium]|nr:adenylosuccinate lyase [Myxococcales bacterium]